MCIVWDPMGNPLTSCAGVCDVRISDLLWMERFFWTFLWFLDSLSFEAKMHFCLEFPISL